MLKILVKIVVLSRVELNFINEFNNVSYLSCWKFGDVIVALDLLIYEVVSLFVE